MTVHAGKIDFDIIVEGFAKPGGKITLGIDGFIDEVWQIIESRANNDEYRLYRRMIDFSQTLAGCDEGGFSNEIIRNRRSAGGFTANTGRAVSRLGVGFSLLAMFGKDGVDPVFAELDATGNLVSVGDPGICQIYEFADGKLMFPYIQEIMKFNWRSLTEAVDEGELKKLFAGSDIIAIGYWSLLPAFNEIVENICGLLRGCGGGGCGGDGGDRQRRMFFDFADIRKRDRASLETTLEKLAGLGSRIPMTLSLNEHEATLLYSYYGEEFDTQDGEGADARTERVRSAIGIDELVAHTPYFAAAASAKEGCCVTPQNYCTSPLITTGAGDNFNAGYLAALLKGLPMPERLTVANAVTYLFVSRGRSPGIDEVFEEIKKNV